MTNFEPRDWCAVRDLGVGEWAALGSAASGGGQRHRDAKTTQKRPRSTGPNEAVFAVPRRSRPPNPAVTTDNVGSKGQTAPMPEVGEAFVRSYPKSTVLQQWTLLSPSDLRVQAPSVMG